MLDYYLDYLKNWNNIKGTMSRHDYWSGLLTILLIISALLWFGAKIPFLNFLPLVFVVAMLVPYLTATTRRLHDVGRKTWFILLIVIPVAGWLCIFVETIQQTKDDEYFEQKSKAKEQKKIPLLNTRL